MEDQEAQMMIRDLGMQVAQMAVDLAQTRAQLATAQQKLAEYEGKEEAPDPQPRKTAKGNPKRAKEEESDGKALQAVQ